MVLNLKKKYAGVFLQHLAFTRSFINDFRHQLRNSVADKGGFEDTEERYIIMIDMAPLETWGGCPLSRPWFFLPMNLNGHIAINAIFYVVCEYVYIIYSKLCWHL